MACKHVFVFVWLLVLSLACVAFVLSYEVDDMTILVEQVDLLNGWDIASAQLLEGGLQLLVISGRSLVNDLRKGERRMDKGTN